MKSLIQTLMLVLIPVALSGCMSYVNMEQQMQKALREHDEQLSKEYLEKLSIISGRLDGMNRAVVKGLTESLDTSRTARELAEEALALAKSGRAGGEEELEEEAEEEAPAEELQFQEEGGVQ